MTDLPVAQNPGESILKEAEAVYPRSRALALGYRAVFGRLWLTDQRLIFRGAASGGVLSLPLGHVVDAAPSERTMRTAQRGDETGAFTPVSTLMVVTFDNGGREYFAVKDLAGWTDSIQAAQSKALPLPYSDRPRRWQGVETSFGRLVLWLGGAALLMCSGLICCLTFAPLFPALLAVLGSTGK
jgi:hypothetical protein